jgi:hypothetical protein
MAKAKELGPMAIAMMVIGSMEKSRDRGYMCGLMGVSIKGLSVKVNNMGRADAPGLMGIFMMGSGTKTRLLG